MSIVCLILFYVLCLFLIQCVCLNVFRAGSRTSITLADLILFSNKLIRIRRYFNHFLKLDRKATVDIGNKIYSINFCLVLNVPRLNAILGTDLSLIAKLQ